MNRFEFTQTSHLTKVYIVSGLQNELFPIVSKMCHLPHHKLHPLHPSSKFSKICWLCCCYSCSCILVKKKQKTCKSFGKEQLIRQAIKKIKEASRSKKVMKVCKECTCTPVLPDHWLLPGIPLGSIQLCPVSSGHCQHPKHLARL